MRALDIQPEAACLDLRHLRRLVDAALAARGELEVLDCIGDVDRAAVDAGLLHRPVHHLAGRADEWAADRVLLIARLLADEHRRRVRRTLAEHGLGGRFVQRAALADRGFLARLCADPRPAWCAARRDPAPDGRAGEGPRPPPRPREPRRPSSPAPAACRGGLFPPRPQGLVVRRVPQPGPEQQRRSVPMRGAVRRDDRPCQVGKPARDQLRIGRQHEMRGFEPAQEPRAAVFRHRHEPHIRAHADGHRREPPAPSARASARSGSVASSSSFSPALTRQTRL